MNVPLLCNAPKRINNILTLSNIEILLIPRELKTDFAKVPDFMRCCFYKLSFSAEINGISLSV